MAVPSTTQAWVADRNSRMSQIADGILSLDHHSFSDGGSHGPFETVEMNIVWSKENHLGLFRPKRCRTVAGYHIGYLARRLSLRQKQHSFAKASECTSSPFSNWGIRKTLTWLRRDLKKLVYMYMLISVQICSLQQFERFSCNAPEVGYISFTSSLIIGNYYHQPAVTL
jgi:hypothetical protein